ncbi:MAG TPA: D-alanyl-D-alanine carboxypeptidase/D-alanyl-D-alanine-endopeptidase [Streptosporangiaceae bacterium]|nr:D-alanyl-D-alanine carboxypeptidase/D-alanyl-D-alanine-endopeptidase [Streptosporangiaceae bacterium]
MLRSTRAVALITLIMLDVFTIAAGVAVARMLPRRLALLQPLRVAALPEVRASPVLRSSGSGGPLPTSAGLAGALTGLLTAPALGSGVAAVIADASGQVLYSRNGSVPTAPASTEKVATAVAALDVLGPGTRFTTRVVSGPDGSIVLVGGGDPTLAAGTPPSSDYPQPATLKELAAKTANALKARHRDKVRLNYDTSLYTGPGMAPGWPGGYITTGNVTPITSLEVDQGRLTPGGAPEDADDPVNFRPRSADPVSVAVSAFEGFLTRDGIRVNGTPASVTAAPGAAVLGSVSSPPVQAIAEWMLLESNNVIAENLARHVAIAMGRPASFAGAAAAEAAVLRRLGAGTGVRLVDGSGLSPEDQIAPEALVRLLSVAASPRHAALRAVITGLPVAGFSGTLSAGQSVFGAIGGAARGVVRAKTGNLDTVAALAGFAYDSDGRLLVFVFNAAKLPKAADLQAAANTIDNAAAVVAACGCR